jgi:hypothetical protein
MGAKRDLAGQQFGRWKVIGFDRSDPDKGAYWICVCECGRESSVRGAELHRGRSQSCGCTNQRRDLTGRQFGHWRVIRFDRTRIGRRAYWVCVCECGRESSVGGTELGRGKSQSCRHCAQQSHGMSRSSEYGSWESMIRRCTNPHDAAWKYYGGRGITVCDRWLHSFENFFADMGPRPEGMTLDRRDNDRGYSPDNCRWATWAVQIANRRPWGKRAVYVAKDVMTNTGTAVTETRTGSY